MKRKPFFLVWAVAFLALGWSGLALGATVGQLPMSEDYQSGELPHDHLVSIFPYFYSFTPWSFSTDGEARTAVVADTSLLETAKIPAGMFVLDDRHTGAGVGRTRGNYYSCDSEMVLNSHAMHLGRSGRVDVTFSVYESSSADGTYSVVSSTLVTASAGTNEVSSGEVNVPFARGAITLSRLVGII